MSWPQVTLIECPRGGHNMVAEDGFCEHCAEADMEAGACLACDLGAGYPKAHTGIGPRCPSTWPRCAHGSFSEDCEDCIRVTP